MHQKVKENGQMNVRIQIIVAVGVIIALSIIINMIRKKSLELKYALAWLIVGTGILILDLFPVIMKKLAAFMGIELPVNMLFFFGFCFSLILIFILTIVVSRLSARVKELAQEIALYEKRMEEKQNVKGEGINE